MLEGSVGCVKEQRLVVARGYGYVEVLLKGYELMGRL